jgi:hypothetical protein
MKNRERKREGREHLIMTNPAFWKAIPTSKRLTHHAFVPDHFITLCPALENWNHSADWKKSQKGIEFEKKVLRERKEEKDLTKPVGIQQKIWTEKM